MMDYRILFIDEESTQHDDFLDYFERVCPEIAPLCLFPAATLEEMFATIDEYHPDAVVTDYRLNEIRVDIKYPVRYNGVELIQFIRDHREGFPCFVITSFDDEAVNATDDVNTIYVKNILTTKGDKAKVSFAQRIISQIEKYRTGIDKARRELAELIEKRNGGTASVFDEERIIELDSFLEKRYGALDAVPKEMKKLSNLNRLNLLINKVDDLLKISE